MLAAIKNDGSAIKYADKKLTADKKVILAAVKNYSDALEFADKKLKADKEVVLAAIKIEGRNIRYIDKKLTADKDIILAAITKSAYNLEFADEKLKSDKKFILLAIKKNSSVLEFVDEKLKADDEIVQAAIKDDPSLIQYAANKIKSDEVFMKNHIKEKDIFKKYFIKNKKLKEYTYSVEISGSGGERKSSEITKKTYDFFVNDNDLLISHVHDDNNEDIPKDVMIGPWYDAGDFFESSSYSFGDSSISFHLNNKVIEIPLNDKILKKMGVNLTRTNKNFKDGLKKGQTKYFFLGERVEKGTTSSELIIDHAFNPKNLNVETCNFNGWEIIIAITYNQHSIDCYMGDSTHKNQEFKVIKVTN